MKSTIAPRTAAPAAPVHEPHLLRLDEVAIRLRVSRRTVSSWIAAGKLPAKIGSSRYVRVLESDLLAFMANLPARPTRFNRGEV